MSSITISSIFFPLITVLDEGSFIWNLYVHVNVIFLGEKDHHNQNGWYRRHYFAKSVRWWRVAKPDKFHVLLFPVDRDTHKFFCRLQSYVFDAASLFQTNHVVHWNAPREDIFFCVASWLFVLRDVHSQRIDLQEESSPWFLSAIELSAWPLFISWR